MLSELPARQSAYPALLKAHGNLFEAKRSPAIDAILRKADELEARGPSPAIRQMLKDYGKPEDPLLKGGEGPVIGRHQSRNIVTGTNTHGG
jgi:hypothetical protein